MSLIFDRETYLEMYSFPDSPLAARRRAKYLESALPGMKERSLLVAGCGMGHLVAELRELGFESVIGMDASPYSVECARERCGDEAIVQGDILQGVPECDIVVSEDVLPCCESLDEAQEMAFRLSARWVIHFVTPHSARLRVRDERLLWLTLERWSKVTFPHPVVDASCR